jgi:sarcosine oxidase
MAMEALGLWREIESDAGRELIVTLGGLDFGRGQEVGAHARALESCGAKFEVLDGAEAVRRFPLVSLPGDEPALFQPDAGIALADQAVRSFAEQAVARGAELRQGHRVIGLQPGSGGVEIETADGTLRARAAVVTAGAWARKVLSTCGIEVPVTPTRQTVAYFPMADELTAPIMVDWSTMVYSLADPGRGVKAGVHRPNMELDPDEDGERPIDPQTVELLASWVGEHYPKADPAAATAETCLYTSTADERFILERHGPIVVGSACSGHAFKFAPLIGERLAGLAREVL